MFAPKNHNDTRYPATESLVIVENETEWITTAAAAEIMGVAKQHVQYLCRAKDSEKEIECKRFGRAWMVSKASAEDWKRKKSGRPKGS